MSLTMQIRVVRCWSRSGAIGGGGHRYRIRDRGRRLLSLSPEQYWEAVSTHSGLFIHRLENIDDDERPALEDEMIEAIEEFIEESRNAVEMEYRLTTATVT